MTRPLITWRQRKQLNGISNRYADEKVKLNYGYLKHKRLKPIAEQAGILAEIFSLSLDGTMEFIAKVLPTLSLPEGAEGWGAFPLVDAVVARFFPEIKDLAERYCRVTNLVLEKIGSTRKFHNYREGEITPDRFRQHARTAHALNLIAERQKNDILIFPFQFGKRHAGRSVRRAHEVLTGSEFGLGGLHTGSQLLIHPERLGSFKDLRIDCPGDKFTPVADGRFSGAPYFSFHGGEVRLNTHWVDHAHDHYGSASGFLFQ